MVNIGIIIGSISAALIIGVIIGYIASGQNVNANVKEQLEEQSKTRVRLVIQPTASPQDIQAQATELEKFLEQKTGYDITIHVPMTYAGTIEALRFNQADLAFVSAWPAYLATKKADATLELAEVRNVVIGDVSTNETYYYSYWVVLKDSPYNSLEELRGKRVAFPSTLSTSGYVAPLAKLVELGYLEREEGKEADPKKFFSEVYFAGGYAQAWEALKNKQVDVSIIAGDVSEKLYREVLANTRIIEEQGPLPSHGVVFNKNMDPTVKANIKKALIELGNTEEGRAIMRKLVSAIFVGFKETDINTHLSSLGQALDLTGLRFTEMMK